MHTAMVWECVCRGVPVVYSDGRRSAQCWWGGSIRGGKGPLCAVLLNRTGKYKLFLIIYFKAKKSFSITLNRTLIYTELYSRAKRGGHERVKERESGTPHEGQLEAIHVHRSPKILWYIHTHYIYHIPPPILYKHPPYMTLLLTPPALFFWYMREEVLGGKGGVRRRGGGVSPPHSSNIRVTHPVMLSWTFL